MMTEKELRSNIYNGWVDKLPDDAASTEGALVVDGTPTNAAAAYSPVIVDKADFATWKEVDKATYFRNPRIIKVFNKSQ